MICPTCEGLGYILIDLYHIGYSYKHKSTCNLCWGKKEIDWVENIFGSEKPHYIKRSYNIDKDEWLYHV